MLLRDLCINRSNHHKPTFYPLGDFFKPGLGPVRTRFKEITKWVKIGFCQSSLIYAKVSLNIKTMSTSVEHSNKDKCFFGKLEMIDDLATFEVDTVENLERNFQDSVNHYIDTCKQLNREAQNL
ncbi:hypothetical protein [uncultured Gammaproteobacteria bacterium]|nr:hypothetical protein [uncultured Gammaproteobacteria bacterium]CAC9977506.1 hypothetical protein [uncultured Gammaproteobacteria bacterium]